MQTEQSSYSIMRESKDRPEDSDRDTQQLIGKKIFTFHPYRLMYLLIYFMNMNVLYINYNTTIFLLSSSSCNDW